MHSNLHSEEKVLYIFLHEKTIICSALLAILSTANARIWTATNGKTVDAEVIKANPDRTVKLALANGKKVTVPFKSFVADDVQFLESLLRIPGGILDKVSWEQMNELFGIPLFQDAILFDDSPAEIAARLKLKEEAHTDFFRSYNAYTRRVFGLDAKYISLRADPTEFQGTTFVLTPDARKENERCALALKKTLIDLLGAPRTSCLFDFEEIRRWNWNGLAITLSSQEGYVVVRIVPMELLDNPPRLTGAQIKERCASSVQTEDDGTVQINIPHMNSRKRLQGLQECLLRYYGIPADQESLSLASKLNKNNDLRSQRKMWKRFLAEYELEWQMLEPKDLFRGGDQGKGIPIRNIKKYIDAGFPILTYRNVNITDLTAKNEADATIQYSGYLLITGYNEKEETLIALYVGKGNPKPRVGSFLSMEEQKRLFIGISFILTPK